MNTLDTRPSEDSQTVLLLEPEYSTTGHTQRQLGAYYTPNVLAEWVAELALREATSLDGENLLVLDPACGDGALLGAIKVVAGDACDLVGFDLDPKALASAGEGLDGTAHLVQADALMVDTEKLLDRRPDVVIANPPWGAELSINRKTLQEKFELAKGQFDSYELFIERYLGVAAPGGVLAFIVPDSILAPEHKETRELLLSRSELVLIARLGEGFFTGVFRGTVVLVFRNQRPQANHTVTCFRLNHDDRQKVLTGERSLRDIESERSHSAPQKRFAEHPQSEFQIDVRPEELTIMQRLTTVGPSWTDWFQSGRGVEIGKSGEILMCPNCRTARPVPRGGVTSCTRCGLELNVDQMKMSVTVPKRLDVASQDWVPLIVGEDVDRYSANPSKLIQLGVQGINYKDPSVFAGKRLLVRKTGVGLKAAIDATGAYTNQVVFHFIAKSGLPHFITEYVQGVLCSRVMLAVHLRRSGETEWRSHPYVTPKSLGTLPIPSIGVEGGWAWKQAAAIADAVERRPSLAGPHHEADVRIERLVAGIYGLSVSECDWALQVIDRAQPLQAISSLRLTDRSLLYPVKVA